MKRVAHILPAVLFGVFVFAGAPGHMDAFRQAVGTNGVAAAKALVDRVEWRNVRDPAAEIRALKKQVEGRAGFEGVERELKTKLRLLTPGAKMDGGDGTLAVPVTEAPVVAVVPVPVPHLRVVRVPIEETDFRVAVPVTGAGSLCVPATGAGGLYVPVAFSCPLPVFVVSLWSDISDGLEDTFGVFVAGRDRWAARYGKLRRFRNGDGTEFTPDWGTALHRMRQEMDSDPGRYDALIDGYNGRMERLLWRARALKGQGVSR